MNEAAFSAIYKNPYFKRQIMSQILLFDVTRINQMPKIFMEYMMLWLYETALLVLTKDCGK